MQSSRARLVVLERFIKNKSDITEVRRILKTIREAAYNQEPQNGKITINLTDTK